VTSSGQTAHGCGQGEVHVCSCARWSESGPTPPCHGAGQRFVQCRFEEEPVSIHG
jgi:hypothetical protein